MLDSLALFNTSINYEPQREMLIVSISTMQQSIQNMQAQQQSIINGKLNAAILLNQIIIPQEIPEENQKAMNEVNLNVKLYGDSVAPTYIPVVLPIALQCPFSGGRAVYQARVFISEYYSNVMQYNDETVCLEQGIFRQEKNEIKTKEFTADDFVIVPNPANNYFQIKIGKTEKGICKMFIYDSVNKLQMQDKLDCSKAVNNVTTDKLISGVYHVKLITESGNVFIKKLAIVK